MARDEATVDLDTSENHVTSHNTAESLVLQRPEHPRMEAWNLARIISRIGQSCTFRSI